MDNVGCVAKLNGTPIYAISAKEYVKMRLDTIGVFVEDYIYMIVDKNNYLIQGNRVMGQALDHCRRVKRINGADWIDFLKNEIEVYQEKSVVITERPTVEFLNMEGQKKLNQVVIETNKKVNELVGSGEAALNQVSKTGAQALENQVKNTNTIVKRASRRVRS